MELEYNNDAPSGAEEMLSAIRDREKTYKEEDLSSDLNWLEASGKIYQMNNDGEKFQGDPKALAKYGIDQMSEFNYNVSLGTIPDVMKVEKADHDTQVAFAYMMDTYDKKDITLDGVGRALKETMTDPLTYVGISTLGAGFAAKKGVQYAAKEGFKNRLHGAIRSYLTSGLAVGATEGALYTAGDEVARESVYQDAGLMEGYSPTNIAASAAVGGLAGAGLVKGIEVAGKGIGKGIGYVRKQGEEAMAQVAGGGTPPSTTKVYHGTSAKFDKFDTKYSGSNMGLDKGTVFFTTSKDRAATFDSRYPRKSRYRYTEDDKQNEQLANNSVKEADLSEESILTLQDVIELYDKGIIKTQPKIDNLFRAESGYDNNREAIAEAIKATGKKVFKHTAEGETQYAVFDTSAIKETK